MSELYLDADYESKLSLRQLRERGCVSFGTIQPCLPEGYGYDSCNFRDIRGSIDEGDPVIVSMIPNSNLRAWFISGQDPHHTMVIHGYDDENYYVISDGDKYKVDQISLDKTRSRAGFACLKR